MITLFRIVLMLLIIYLPLPLMACGTETQIGKKPEGLRTKDDPSTSYGFIAKDRQQWKSVLNWCDECHERAKNFTESDSGINSGMYIYPIGCNQYIVDIKCEMSMRQCEHIYYKVTEHAGTTKSRLLILKQFYHAEYGDDEVKGVKNPKGEFVRYIDSVTYGFTINPENQKRLIIETEYSGMGNCGLYTIYDISGDCPKVVEFRAELKCILEPASPEKWQRYPPEQRARWHIVPSPRRYGWKPLSTSPPCLK